VFGRYLRNRFPSRKTDDLRRRIQGGSTVRRERDLHIQEIARAKVMENESAVRCDDHRMLMSSYSCKLRALVKDSHKAKNLSPSKTVDAVRDREMEPRGYGWCRAYERQCTPPEEKTPTVSMDKVHWGESENNETGLHHPA
jgi:hypothetical protein